MNYLEEEILKLIEKRYKCKYVGGIKVTSLGNEGYKLKLYLGNSDKGGIELSAQMNAEDFLKFIDKELISRQLQKVEFFRGIVNYIEDEQRGTC